MESEVKILLLQNGNLNDYLIGTLTEMDEEPSLLVENCYKIIDGKLEEYPKYSSQRDLFLTGDSIFTIVDPSEEILRVYQAVNE
jgi:small nuclear ribonucleoprotein (snRNP)-like protein